MSVQQTVWGNIEWMDPWNRTEHVNSRFGIKTMEGHSYQRPHVHYDEQIMHVLKGSGVHWIDGQSYGLRPGRTYFIPRGSTHEILNDTNEPLLYYLFTTVAPAQPSHKEYLTPSSADVNFNDFQNDPLLFVINQEKDIILNTENFPLTVFDAGYHPIFRSEYYPLICRQACGDLIRDGRCPCMKRHGVDNPRFEFSYTCAQGIKTFSVPVAYKNIFLGNIMGGYIRPVDSSHLNMDGSYSVEQSAIDGVFTFLRGLAIDIEDRCGLLEMQLSLQLSSEKQASIQQDLEQKQFELSSLKINYHFLFNTLNHMAAMALDGGNPELFNSIIQLSDVFQYSIRREKSFTSLESELSYVRAYLELQKLRYKDRLLLTYDVQKSVKTAKVPANFLQPLVENAFTHGFGTVDVRKLTIRAFSSGKTLNIFVENNGESLKMHEYEAINRRIVSKATHGMSMAYERITSLYENGSIEISAGHSGGSTIKIVMPLEKYEND